ncbi:hypothetical protein GCM10017687_64090 [Streptomyces echinatus]
MGGACPAAAVGPAWLRAVVPLGGTGGRSGTPLARASLPNSGRPWQVAPCPRGRVVRVEAGRRRSYPAGAGKWSESGAAVAHPRGRSPFGNPRAPARKAPRQ